MLEKINQLAEHAATNVSRRHFLGRVGRGAMVVAAATGGLLAARREALGMGRSPHCKAGEKPCIIEVDGKRVRGCCPRVPKKS